MSMHFDFDRHGAAFVTCLFAALAIRPGFAAETMTTAQMLQTAAAGAKEARYTAIDDLGERHEQAAQVVPELIKLLEDSDPQIRWRTTRTLGEYGGQAKSAVAGVRKLLAESDPVVQYHAAVALGKLEDKSDETVMALVTAATHKDPRVARAAISAIRNLKPGPQRVAEVLGNALKSDDQAITLHAMEAVVEMGGQSTPFLKEALKNPDTAYLACTAIEQIGPEAAQAVPELVVILDKTKHSQMLIQTLLALASIGSGAESATPQITPLLEMSTDDTVPVAAAYALGSIGAKNVDSALQKAAQNEDPFLQMMAMWALAKLHPEDAAATKAAIEKLTQSIKSDNPTIRMAAAKSLFSLQLPPEVVAPYLVELINDPNSEVQVHVIEAAASIGEKLVPRLNTGLKNPQLREAAVRVIQKLGPKAGESVQPLLDAAKEDPNLKTQIQLALGAIGPVAAPATDMLVASLDSSDAGERESALYALRKIGPGAKSAVAALKKRMAADDSFEADAAAWALVRVAPKDPQVAADVVAKLTKGLASAEALTQLESIAALVELGATDKAAAQLKRLASEDGDPAVRDAAGAALKN